MPSVMAVVQARMGSTRLPGKSLLPVYGKMPLLEVVLRRTLHATAVSRVVLATSIESACDPLEELAKSLSVDVIRGSEDDVLSRFVVAAKTFCPDHIVRICADNPLLAPEALDRLVADHLEAGNDYTTNCTPECGLPDGLGCEVVKVKALLEADEMSDTPQLREHVLGYILEHPSKYRTGLSKYIVREHFSIEVLDVDTAKDLDRIRRFCLGLPKESGPLWTTQEIVDHASVFFADEEMACE